MLSILMSITNLYRQLYLQETSDTYLSYNFICIDIDKGVSIRLTLLLISLIVYVKMRCIEFIFILHTLICLLVLIYSIKIPFQVQFRSDLTHLSAGIYTYKSELKI